MATNEAHAEIGAPGRPSVDRNVWGWLLAAFRAFAAALALLVFAGAYLAGMLPNVLIFFLLIMVPATLLNRLWNGFHGNLELRLVRHPLGRVSRPYMLQAFNRSMFWVMAAIVLELTLVPIQFEPAEFRGIRIANVSLVTVLIVAQLVPPRRVRVLSNVLYAISWLFLVVECVRIAGPQPSADAVAIHAPFRGEWYVYQGGRSALVNHHFPIQAQRHALDLVMLADGREASGDRQRLDSYAAFGQPLLAPADGNVVRVVNNAPDMPIGETDTRHLVGNHVVIEIGQGRYVLMAHLQKGSVSVSEGEHVRRGQPVARCGNSGNTSGPHLHLQIQSKSNFSASDLRTFPIIFRDIELVRRGHRSRGNVGGLRRNDRIVPPGAPASSNAG